MVMIYRILLLEDIISYNVIDLDNYFFDIDGDVLYYTTGNENINLNINDDHTVDCSAPPDWFGSELVYFRANDPIGAHQEDLVTVTVLPVNDAPVLLSIPAQYGNESERWVLDLEPFIIDVDNNITELSITVDTDYVVASGGTLNFMGSSELPEHVVVTVSDGEFSATQTIDIHLKRTERAQPVTLWDLIVQILPFILIILMIIVVISAFVYRKNTRFTAEEVFLIHEGGTLITHLTRHQQANVDDIIFSGMFTAVQEFIKDTFASDQGQTGEVKNKWLLDELKLGDSNIMIERTENTYLAVIFSGPGSKRLRSIVSGLLDEIEEKYNDILPKWDGNIRELEGTKEILSVLIKQPDKTKEPIEPKVNLPTDKPTHKPMQPPQPKLATKPVESKALVSAQTVLTLNKTSQPKDTCLMSSPNELGGVSNSKLMSWLLNTSQGRINAEVELDRLSMALQMDPKRKIPKTIKIMDGQISSDSTSTEKPAPSGLIEQSSRTVNIALPGCDKELKLDTSKSLLQQLAEYEE